jgi:outer membrane beta-barrel protein
MRLKPPYFSKASVGGRPYDTEHPEVKRLQAILLALCLVPVPALAQKKQKQKEQKEMGLGLDLSTDAPSQDDASDETDSYSEEPPPLPSSIAEPPPAAPLTPAERDVTLDDRVKSIQRKVYLKKNRFELSPLFSFSVNDPYYSKVAAGVRGAYYLADTLAISARVSMNQVLPSDDVRIAKRTFQSRIFYSVPLWSAMGDVEWSPIYGKVAFLNSILHFDAYLLGGVGVVTTEMSGQEGRGPNPAADLGLGVRFVARDFLAVNVALINTSYVDQPLSSLKGATQNMLTLNAGISIFFPLKSTGRESE